MINTFSLRLLLNLTWTVYRNPAPVGGKVGPKAAVGTVPYGRIFPADSDTAKLIPAPMLAGGRSTDVGIAVGAADVRAGDEVEEGGVRYAVDHVSDWEGAVTVVSLSRQIGGIL